MADIRDQIVAYARQYGLDPAYALAVAERESSFRPNAHASQTIHGLFQMSGAERAKYGIPMTTDVGTQVRGFAQYTNDLRADMTQRLGRNPTPSELYLGHYWGPGRAAGVIQGRYNGLPARDVFTPRELADNPNLRANAPVTALAGNIVNDMNNRVTRYGGAAQSGVQVASLGNDFTQYGMDENGNVPAPRTAAPPSRTQQGGPPQGNYTPLESSPGRTPNLSKVSPGLLEAVGRGAATLPDGYRVTINEGFNASGHTSGSQHHIPGSGAIDVQIWGPDGQPISNRGNDPTGMYTRLAQGSYYAAQRLGLGDKFAWGGRFGTVTGGSTPDLMHFDLGGDRGHFGPTLAARFGTAPNTQVASNAPADFTQYGQSEEDAAAARQKQLQTNFDRNKPWLKQGADADTDYATKLSPEDEGKFKDWVSQNKVPFDPNATGPQDYDMRGYWKGLQDGDPNAKTAPDPNDVDPNTGQPRTHYPDYWKTPYHETFSKDSQWANPDTAPSWNDKDQLIDKDGNVLFDDKAQPQPAPGPGTENVAQNAPTQTPTQAPAASTQTASTTTSSPPPQTDFTDYGTKTASSDAVGQTISQMAQNDSTSDNPLADVATGLGNFASKSSSPSTGGSPFPQSNDDVYAALAMRQAQTPIAGIGSMPGQQSQQSGLMPGAQAQQPPGFNLAMFGIPQQQQA